LDEKLKLSNFVNWHISASFDRVYLKNCKK